MHACMHACMHSYSYINPFIHTCIHTYTPLHICAAYGNAQFPYIRNVRPRGSSTDNSSACVISQNGCSVWLLYCTCCYDHNASLQPPFSPPRLSSSASRWLLAVPDTAGKQHKQTPWNMPATSTSLWCIVTRRCVVALETC